MGHGSEPGGSLHGAVLAPAGSSSGEPGTATAPRAAAGTARHYKAVRKEQFVTACEDPATAAFKHGLSNPKEICSACACCCTAAPGRAGAGRGSLAGALPRHGAAGLCKGGGDLHIQGSSGDAGGLCWSRRGSTKQGHAHCKSATTRTEQETNAKPSPEVISEEA